MFNLSLAYGLKYAGASPGEIRDPVVDAHPEGARAQTIVDRALYSSVTMGTKRKAVDSDHELLKTGKFSDITVKCGDRTWNLHRAILTSRCEYFRAALEDGKFKEAQEQLIEIHDQDPNHVNWVIHYIYTEIGPKDLRVLFTDEQAVMNTCVDLFTVADYFTLDSLCDDACQVLADFIVDRAVRVYSELYPFVGYGYQGKEEMAELLEKHVTKEFLERFFSVVKKVYSIGSSSFTPLKHALLLYPSLTFCTTLREDVFGDTIFKDPELAEFGVDILKAVFGTGSVRKLLDKVQECALCRAETRGFIKFVVKRQDNAYTIDAWCRTCANRKYLTTPLPNIPFPEPKRRRVASSKKPCPNHPTNRKLPRLDRPDPTVRQQPLHHPLNPTAQQQPLPTAHLTRRQPINTNEPPVVRLVYPRNEGESDSSEGE
ncbi:hypothetical protein O1611_g2717 [Lasiodiplodia mahajangana]|uniref:Uncharacterized protein n=1 Tax=Lasiodiplodia mahajangana TaxID=1108764 RepID=A0ACC2JTR8_9PEZI|nr:hypothetical protein O1611_g2717 [Lasiodiplodia mahajangana]